MTCPLIDPILIQMLNYSISDPRCRRQLRLITHRGLFPLGSEAGDSSGTLCWPLIGQLAPMLASDWSRQPLSLGARSVPVRGRPVHTRPDRATTASVSVQAASEVRGG